MNLIRASHMMTALRGVGCPEADKRTDRLCECDSDTSGGGLKISKTLRTSYINECTARGNLHNLMK